MLSESFASGETELDVDNAPLSSLSECARRMSGLSEERLLTDKPDALVLAMIRFPALDETGSKPAKIKRWFAFSRSCRIRSLSEARRAD